VRAYVIGSPVDHSLSPSIFFYLSAGKLDYKKMDVTPSMLTSFLSRSREDEDLLGFNVTIPLKEDVATLVDELSSEAKFVGAVNVVTIKNKKLIGYNTDVIGIERTLYSYFSSLQDLTSVVLGAGGSARALVFVLGKLKCKNVFIYNPRSDRGEELVQYASKVFPETTFKAIRDLKDIFSFKISLIVNTTPLGMESKSQNVINFFEPIRSLCFSDDALAFDFIYSPVQTPFIQETKQLGIRSVNGLGMLIDQAIATWIIWFKESEEMYKYHQDLKIFLESILNIKNKKKPIFLTGFMGVGKSTVGQILSHLTGRIFLDTDRMIELAMDKSIPEIFLNEGESFFRELEKKTVLDCLNKSNCVVSLGGGALLKEEVFQEINSKAYVIYLSATVNDLFERLKHEVHKRPLLKDLDDQNKKIKIGELLAERKDHYEAVPIEINTNKLSSQDVALAIISKLSEVT